MSNGSELGIQSARSATALRDSLAPGEWDIFISYSRKDQDFARKLHAALNAYHPPRSLPLPQRRIHAFLDTLDYAGADYNPEIRKNLQNASKLLVICSPNAVKSRFVGPEIDDFLSLHQAADGTSRVDVIPLILDGLPLNETTGLSDPQNAFPAALSRALSFPIAVDYRGFDLNQHRLQEGKYHNAWFTLLALVFEHSRAVLEERERKRRARIVLVRASIAGAVGVSLLALSIWALVERGTAVEQRTLAYARKLAAEAQFALTDVLAPAAPAVSKALGALALSASAEAESALDIGVQRLPPLALGALPFDPADGIPTLLKFGPNGHFLLGITGRYVLLWNVRTRELLVRHQLDGGASLAGFGNDGASVALTMRDKSERGAPRRLLLIDLASGAVIERVYARILDAAVTDEGVRVLAADPNGARLQLVDPVSNTTLRELHLATPAKMARLRPRDGGLFVADGANNAWAYLRDPAAQAVRYEIPSGASPVAFAVEAGLIALETRAGALAIVDIATGQSVIGIPANSYGRFIGFFGDDRFLAVSGERGRDYYSIELRKRILAGRQEMPRHYDLEKRREIGNSLIEAGASDDGRLFFTAYDDGHISASTVGVAPMMLPGTAPAPELAEVARFQHGEPLGATSWMPISSGSSLFVAANGRYLASQSNRITTTVQGMPVSHKRLIRVWDVYRGEEIARFHPPDQMAVEFAPEGNVIATLTTPDEGRGKALLELWRLTPGADEPTRSLSEPPELAAMEREPASTLAGISASADASRVVWLTLDYQLHLRDRRTGQVIVIDDLRPALKRAWEEVSRTWPGKLHTIDPSLSLEAVVGSNPALNFLRMASTPAPAPESIAAGLLPSLLVMSPSPLFTFRVSGNGRCAIIALGPLIRLYDLENRKVIAERILPDMAPSLSRGAPRNELLIAYDGRAYAIEMETWESLAQAFPSPKAEEEERLLSKRKILVFRTDSTAPVGTLEGESMASLRMTWPLAVDSLGRLIALQQVKSAGPAEHTARIAVLRTADGTTVFETPASSIDLVSGDLDAVSALGSTTGAFSADDRRLAILQTRAACPSVVAMLPTGMPVRIPFCPEKRVNAEIWRVDDGLREAAASFEFQPVTLGPVPGLPPLNASAFPSRSVLGLAFLDEQTVAQTAIEPAPTANPGNARLVTERFHMEGSRKTANACARLPRDTGIMRREAWERELPGEPYRPICP